LQQYSGKKKSHSWRRLVEQQRQFRRTTDGILLSHRLASASFAHLLQNTLAVSTTLAQPMLMWVIGALTSLSSENRLINRQKETHAFSHRTEASSCASDRVKLSLVDKTCSRSQIVGNLFMFLSPSSICSSKPRLDSLIGLWCNREQHCRPHKRHHITDSCE
jgi:hypothetical protein